MAGHNRYFKTILRSPKHLKTARSLVPHARANQFRTEPYSTDFLSFFHFHMRALFGRLPMVFEGIMAAGFPSSTFLARKPNSAEQRLSLAFTAAGLKFTSNKHLLLRPKESSRSLVNWNDDTVQ